MKTTLNPFRSLKAQTMKCPCKLKMIEMDFSGSMKTSRRGVERQNLLLKTHTQKKKTSGEINNNDDFEKLKKKKTLRSIRVSIYLDIYKYVNPNPENLLHSQLSADQNMYLGDVMLSRSRPNQTFFYASTAGQVARSFPGTLHMVSYDCELVWMSSHCRDREPTSKKKHSFFFLNSIKTYLLFFFLLLQNMKNCSRRQPVMRQPSMNSYRHHIGRRCENE